LNSIKGEELLVQLSDYRLLKWDHTLFYTTNNFIRGKLFLRKSMKYEFNFMWNIDYIESI
jgi:hypothetical protein